MRAFHRTPAPFSFAIGVVLLALAWGSILGCDRNLEPFDPEEEPRQPDLARIFPDDQQQGPGLRAAAPTGGFGEAPASLRPPATAPSSSGPDPLPIRGRIEVSPELAKDVRPGGVLFLIARSGSSPGPPLAVRKFTSPSFPLEFEIGPSDLMIASTRFEGAIQLTARLDSDGNAMTRLPGDLQGAVPTPLSPGARGALLTLDEKL